MSIELHPRARGAKTPRGGIQAEKEVIRPQEGDSQEGGGASSSLRHEAPEGVAGEEVLGGRQDGDGGAEAPRVREGASGGDARKEHRGHHVGAHPGQGRPRQGQKEKEEKGTGERLTGCLNSLRIWVGLTLTLI